MRRARLGLCIGDREYGDRFTSCLMNHYRDQLELHMFSQKEALQENWKTLDAIVLSDDLAGENRIECEIPQIYLSDGPGASCYEKTEIRRKTRRSGRV